ncbi:MAG: molybdate ABC transporter permease subunit, partial [Caulobacteraceae bacterium]|nr:molybdate ABC transporter permease subunit [Caulobacteraceae bacterium]
RAFGEFGATVTFAGAIPGETQTLPLAIYSVLQSADGGQAALRLSVVAVLVSVAAVVGSEMCNRRILQARRA